MIELLLGTRQSGRTTKFIQWAAEEQLCIVVRDHNRADHVERMARTLGLRIPAPITFDSLVGVPQTGSKGFLIDDMDDIIVGLGRGVPILGASIEVGEECYMWPVMRRRT